MFGAGPQTGRIFDYSKILGSSVFQVQLCSESVSYEQSSRLYIFQRLPQNLKRSLKAGWSFTLSSAADSSRSTGNSSLRCGQLVEALEHRSGAAAPSLHSGRNADSRAGAGKLGPSIFACQTVRKRSKTPGVRSGGFRRLLLTKNGTI